MLHELTSRIQNSGLLEVKERLGLISGGRVLDVGTSKGDFIGALMKSLRDYEEFVGIDISEKDLNIARERYQNKPVTFRTANAERMPFTDGSFDTVCMAYSLHHLENIDDVLEEAKRVLRKGGYLIVQEVFSDNNQGDAKLTEIAVHHLDAKVDRMLNVPHLKTYSREKLRSIMNKLGMTRVEVFETTDSLKCIFCENMKDCEDPKSEFNIDLGIRSIDEILQKASTLAAADVISQEAQSLKERIRSTGFESASQLFFICLK